MNSAANATRTTLLCVPPIKGQPLDDSAEAERYTESHNYIRARNYANVPSEKFYFELSSI